VAQRLGWHLLDSGALYRATALAATRAGLAIDAAHEAAIAALAASCRCASKATRSGWAATT
jgi:3-phosphoshikimate 1-carboxyvinyltransferase